jgi:hypothetical protein
MALALTSDIRLLEFISHETHYTQAHTKSPRLHPVVDTPSGVIPEASTL